MSNTNQIDYPYAGTRYIRNLVGTGSIGGAAPPDGVPSHPDGRTYVNSVLRPLKVKVFHADSSIPMAEVRSLADGTWQINGLKLSERWQVIFQNDVYRNDDDVLYNSFIQDWIAAVPSEYDPPANALQLQLPPVIERWSMTASTLVVPISPGALTTPTFTGSFSGVTVSESKYGLQVKYSPNQQVGKYTLQVSASQGADTVSSQLVSTRIVPQDVDTQQFIRGALLGTVAGPATIYSSWYAVVPAARALSGTPLTVDSDPLSGDYPVSLVSDWSTDNLTGVMYNEGAGNWISLTNSYRNGIVFEGWFNVSSWPAAGTTAMLSAVQGAINGPTSLVGFTLTSDKRIGSIHKYGSTNNLRYEAVGDVQYTLPDNTWFHVLCYIPPSQMIGYLYINGQFTDSWMMLKKSVLTGSVNMVVNGFSFMCNNNQGPTGTAVARCNRVAWTESKFSNQNFTPSKAKYHEYQACIHAATYGVGGEAYKEYSALGNGWSTTGNVPQRPVFDPAVGVTLANTTSTDGYAFTDIQRGYGNVRGSLCMEVWFKPQTAYNGDKNIIAFMQAQGTNSGRIHIALNNGNLKVYCQQLDPATAKVGTGTTFVSNDTWHHAALCCDVLGQQWRVYLDGNLELTIPDTNLTPGSLAAVSSMRALILGASLNLLTTNSSTRIPGFHGVIGATRITINGPRLYSNFTPTPMESWDAIPARPTA